MKLLSIFAGLGLALSFSHDTYAQSSAAFFGFKDTTQANIYHQPIDSLKDEDGYYIERNLGIYRKKVKENAIIQLEVQHSIIHINKPALIEELKNHIYGLNEDGALADAYFSVTKPNGNTIILDKNELKPYRTDKKNVLYNYNWKNIEVGDQIECVVGVYTSDLIFRKSNLITEIPTLSSKFLLMTPMSHPVALDVSGLDDHVMYKQNEEEEMDMYYCHLLSLPKNQKEKFSYPKLQSWTVGYSVAKKDGINYLASNWDPYVNYIMENIHNIIAESKSIPTIAASLPIKEDMSAEQKIAIIEEALYKKIGIFNEYQFPESIGIDAGLKKGKLGFMEHVALYAGVLDHFKLDYEVVLLNNRYDEALNLYAPNINNVDHVGIYFPSTGTMLFPTKHMIRMPYMPPLFEQTDRIHIKKSYTKTKDGAYFAQFQLAESTPMDYSITQLLVDLEITPDGWKAQHKLIHTGNQIDSRIDYYHPMSKFKDKLDLTLLPFGLKDYVDSIKVAHATHNFKSIKINGIDSLIQETTTQSKYKFADKQTLQVPIGKLIGKQTYMEPDTDRMYDINLEYRHRLLRTFTVAIPEGYRVKNLADFNYEIVDHENVLGFTSKAVQDGNKIVINLDEYYGELSYDKSLIQVFENVMNAAEKFNKLYLILEKI